MKPDSDSQSDHQWEKKIQILHIIAIIENEKKDVLLYGDYMDPCFPCSNKGPDLELPSYIEPFNKYALLQDCQRCILKLRMPKKWHITTGINVMN